MKFSRRARLVACWFGAGAGCTSPAAVLSTASAPSAVPSQPPAPVAFALALHGGAGVIARDVPEATKRGYVEALTHALTLGREKLAGRASALDACEAVVRQLEDDPKFNAGKGAAYTEAGTHELDAAIMDGRTLGCGAVAGVTTVKNPISLARRVMEASEHVLLAGAGAEAFASLQGVERVDPSYFDTPARWEALQKVLQARRQHHEAPKPRGTVGCVALDQDGNLAAATSTGGLTGKRFGRVGDSPLIGAGTYADNRSGAISCTGTGEEFIRHAVAKDIAALMEYRGLSALDAARTVVEHKLKPDDGGVIVVSRYGDLALVFNTEGMFRAAADSRGRFEVGIWR